MQVFLVIKKNEKVEHITESTRSGYVWILAENHLQWSNGDSHIQTWKVFCLVPKYFCHIKYQEMFAFQRESLTTGDLDIQIWKVFCFGPKIHDQVCFL